MPEETVKCDDCEREIVFSDRYEVRLPSYGIPEDLVCVSWVCRDCGLRHGEGVCRTPDGWDLYIESPEARKAGHSFLR